MKIRRLSGAGVDAFGEYLDSLSGPEPMPFPEALLNDAEMTSEVSPAVTVEERVFASRFEAAEYLSERFSRAGLKDVERDHALWTWLSLFYFKELCPADQDGRHHSGERARLIPELSDFRRYYRHLLAGPFLIYRAHRDDPKRALALLCGPLYRPGEIVGQLAARQEIVTNASLMQLATDLYVDRATGKPKRGSAGKDAGSPRRLADVLNQFDVTWDLYSMASEGILNLLPKEFSKFRQSPART